MVDIIKPLSYIKDKTLQTERKKMTTKTPTADGTKPHAKEKRKEYNETLEKLADELQTTEAKVNEIRSNILRVQGAIVACNEIIGDAPKEGESTA
jgi:chromosome segregation ATPase